jgi:hypothetical protein
MKYKRSTLNLNILLRFLLSWSSFLTSVAVWRTGDDVDEIYLTLPDYSSFDRWFSLGRKKKNPETVFDFGAATSVLNPSIIKDVLTQ